RGSPLVPVNHDRLRPGPAGDGSGSGGDRSITTGLGDEEMNTPGWSRFRCLRWSRTGKPDRGLRRAYIDGGPQKINRQGLSTPRVPSFANAVTRHFCSGPSVGKVQSSSSWPVVVRVEK